MSDRSEPDATQKPEQQGKKGEQPEGEKGTRKKPSIRPLRSTQSLERLRDKVEEAAQELKRLREKNQALAARIAELEARPAAEPGETLVSFEEDPEALRHKVTGFIEAIDQYLANEE